jgi:predicted nucleic acid-binding protein
VSYVRYLLDANALIALTHTDHVNHEAASRWVYNKKTCICPIVEGALVRFLIRVGESGNTASALLELLRSRCEWIPDDVSYGSIDLSETLGHRQVTDTYLLELAKHHRLVLATFDKPLADRGKGNAELIPS